MRIAPWWAAVCVTSVVACGATDAAHERLVVVEDGDGRIAGAHVSAGNATATTDEHGNARLPMSPGTELRVTSDTHCPRTLRLPERMPAIVRVSMARRIDLGPDRGQMGFDTEVTLEARLACAAPGGRVRWERVEGDAASNTPIGGSGRRLRFRTAPFPRETLARIPVGVIPISPRTQGRVVWRAWLEEPGARPVGDEVVVTAAARTQGVPSVPLNTDVYFTASGEVTVATRPPRSFAQPVAAGDGVVRLRPDAIGRYVLRMTSPAGEPRDVVIRVGRYDDTPLDCGRAECHVDESRTAGDTPMGTFLARALTGRVPRASMSSHLGSTSTPADASPPAHAHGQAPYPGGACLRCHAVGVEEGIDTGGFDDVLRGVGLKPADVVHTEAWSEMPRDARRLAGVGCLACHGPGAIPEPTARPLVHRADVCATCHDAPPRYAHVMAWR
ncbi:MAG: hypothetical protein IT379_24330, partial [Deltaproteobacteria bacterium]|nr:hypothetical protein [Deltaproteobacteria bacterium]